MSSTAPPSPEPTRTPSSFTARFEFAGKFTALFIGMVYAFGFLIIAIHHAQFSIPEFDPLKPKIFSTGLIFLVFVGIPMLGSFRTFGLFGLQSPYGFRIGAKPENIAIHKLMLVFGFYYGAYAMASVAGNVPLARGRVDALALKESLNGMLRCHGLSHELPKWKTTRSEDQPSFGGPSLGRSVPVILNRSGVLEKTEIFAFLRSSLDLFPDKVLRFRQSVYWP